MTALREQYENWAAETSARRLFHLAVTHLGGGMGQHPDDDLAQPLGGIWAGLAKTLHREFPNCNARVVDTALSAAEDLPGVVVSELGRTGEIEVGHRDGRRLTLSPVAAPVGPPRREPGPRGLRPGLGRRAGHRLGTRPHTRRAARYAGGRDRP
ncbi:hypothetical protein ACWCRD_18900 [Streptomyces sp. NPDC002092]